MNRSERRRAAYASIHGRKPEVRGVSRPYLGIRFECCGVYARAYRNHDRTAYEARCPACGRAIRIRIGRDGTADRFFRVY